MIERYKVTALAWSAAKKLLLAQLRGAGDEGSDGAAEPVDDAVVFQQLGVAVRPVIAATLRALGYQDGDDVLVLKLWDRAKTPTDLAEGETRLFACGDTAVALKMKTDGVVLTAKGATVTITSAGAVQITPAPGQSITLSGGLLSVARATDLVVAHANMTTWMSQVAGFINAAVPGTVNPAAPVTFGAIAPGAGAATVKA